MTKSCSIGIITLSASDNCGSLLQAYALQHYLTNNLGSTVDIINFTSHASKQLYNIINYRTLSSLPTFLRTIKNYKRLKRQKDDYNLFRKHYLNLTDKKYLGIDSLKGTSFDYDFIIVGSDQVWNVAMGDFDPSFFLSWTALPKVAYAPSLGGHDIDESPNKGDFCSLLNKFLFLSVREEKGQRCLERIVKHDVPVVVDPTLLLDIDVWQSITEERIFFFLWIICFAQ